MSVTPSNSQYDDVLTIAAEDEQRERESGACVFCRCPVDAVRDYRRTNGWTGGPGRDGFIRDGYDDEWAHKHCIEVNKTVGVNQGAFDV